MIPVSQVVSEILPTDELALEAMRERFLNLSAYAAKIHQRIENAAKKPVKKGTVVVALARFAKSLKSVMPLAPDVELANVDVRSSLALLNYAKTPDMERKIAVLHPFTLVSQDLFSITEGPREITVICANSVKDRLVKHFAVKPLSLVTNLVALVAQFKGKTAKPNTLFSLVRAIAGKRISILTTVATLTEVSFIVAKNDMEQALAALNIYFTGEKST